MTKTARTPARFLPPPNEDLTDGLSALPSIAFGATPVSGNLSTAAESTLHAPARRETSSPYHKGSADRLVILDSDGTARCHRDSQCTIQGDGPLALLDIPLPERFLEATIRGHLRQRALRPQRRRRGGCPSQSSGAQRVHGSLLRGRDLGPLQSAKLVREATASTERYTTLRQMGAQPRSGSTLRTRRRAHGNSRLHS